MSRAKSLINKAKERNLQAKQLVMKLLSEPMTNEQKEIILELYRIVK